MRMPSLPFISSWILLALLFSGILFVDASLKKNKSDDVSIKRQSHNNIPMKEKSLETQQHYYLPLQTEFGSSESLFTTSGLTTSPPELIINPAPITTEFQEHTLVLTEDSHAKSYYKWADPESLCVSETPVSELQSNIILSSNVVSKESAVLTGHLDIPSKTSSEDEDPSDINRFVSQPSIALEGTMLHSHLASDL